jgi:nitrite reductase/ring-hydroxylating ferredoxin subunit
MPNHGPCPHRQTCLAEKPQLSRMLSRRHWIKCFALGSIASAGLRRATLADISPAANVANIISLRLTDFPALLTTYGSVRVELLPNLSINESRLIITRAPGDVFYAVTAICTHQQQLADPYDHTEETRSINCYVHGSRYDMQGNVLTPGDGGSSQPSLTKYNTSYANGVVRVEIPGLNFKMNSMALQSTTGTTSRYVLNFTRRNGGRYRVLYTPDLATEPVPVNFATSSSGALNRGPSFASQTFNATSTGNQNLGVDSSAERGFYLVELVVTQDMALLPP